MLDFSLLNKIYLWSRAEAVRAVLDCYNTTWSCIVNFLYFTNLAHERLVEWTPEPAQQQYRDALQDGDFLFADGIALQLFYRWFAEWTSGAMPENLNGTDLNPLLIEYILQEHTTSMYLYQCYDPPKGKTVAFLQTGIDAVEQRFPWLHVHRSDQCLFREKGKEFAWTALEAAVAQDHAEVKIFFNCTGSPFQEFRVKEHEEKLRSLGLLIINAWGTIDYLSGFEKRAPQRVVKARVLETLWRIITKPKKNFTKFLKMFGFFRILRKNITFKVKKLLQLTSR